MEKIVTPGSLHDVKFEKAYVHETLVIVREVSKKGVIGYLNKHPQEQSWFWFMMNDYSEFFNTEDDAMESLIHAFLTTKFNKMAKAAGTLNNEKYTKF